MSGLLTIVPSSLSISVSRLGGAGGENSQWSLAVPNALAQNVTRATRKSPVAAGLASAPEAKAIEAGGATILPKSHGKLPLHTSFCNTASNVAVSGETVVLTTPQAPVVAEATCNSEFV